jgi:hypothetical protein
MGRSGIAMTFVTDQELGVLKSLFKMNHIDPVWHGNIPNLQNLQAVSQYNGKQESKKYFKKRPRPISHGRTSSQKSTVEKQVSVSP